MITLRAGLYACSPEALAEIVDRALTKLDAHDSRDRITLALELVGIELGEIRHAKQAEVDLAKKQLREARADMGEMTSWCWQVCQDVAERFSNDARIWRRFEAAIRNCSSLCASVAARSGNGYRLRTGNAADGMQSSARRGF